jgi:ABC-type multidrug transport system fused ATPase/permease subunit
MNSDRVMVMERGKLMEMDTPNNLLANPHSKFYNMINNINEVVE